MSYEKRRVDEPIKMMACLEKEKASSTGMARQRPKTGPVALFSPDVAAAFFVSSYVHAVVFISFQLAPEGDPVDTDDFGGLCLVAVNAFQN